MARRRSAITRMICNANFGVCWTMNMKRRSVIGTSLQLVTAVAVALRGATVDQRHLAHDAAGPEQIDFHAFDAEAHLAFEHHVHELTGLAFAKHGRTRVEGLKFGLVTEQINLHHWFSLLVCGYGGPATLPKYCNRITVS